MFSLLLTFVLSGNLHAKEIKTNELIIAEAPDWLMRSHVEEVTDKIQSHLEWRIRRTNVEWYYDEVDYEDHQSYGPTAAAVTKFDSGAPRIIVGPKVSKDNFDKIFGHELVHVIVFQKYKQAIPKWLEEGLANYLSNDGKVDYKWLAQQPFPEDVRDLAHPYSGSPFQVTYRYKASQAFAEMLAKNCHLEDLLRLSVGRNMETYMSTYCEIKNLNSAFHDWVLSKAKGA